MAASKRPPLLTAFQILLLLSGWAVAVALGLRHWNTPRHLPVAPPAQAAPEIVTATPPEGKFERIFREWTEDPKVAGALIGFCLLDEDGGTVFASPLAASALCPASALKTVTTGAAFGLLGPDFRFETTLAGTGALDAAGNLEGDLVLVGGGDPTFSLDDLAALADAAIASGLKAVKGRVWVDASVFPHDPTNEQWNWGDIGNAYGAGAFGLNLNHNRMEVHFGAGTQPGDPVKILASGPVARDTRWENHVVTAAPGGGDEVVIYSEPYGRRITLRGSVPADVPDFPIYGAIPDPPALAAETLRAHLEAAGIKFGDAPGPFTQSEPTTLAHHPSAPLAEIIDHLHKVSDNLEAQCLFITIGLRQNTAPAEAVRQYWEKAGVSFAGLRLLDGSGLARANMIRPIDLARVNLAARRGPHGQRFFESLTKYADGAARGKIGGMSGVKTQVGFVHTAAGRDLTFALMANGLPVDRSFWTRLDALLKTVRDTEL